MSADEATWAEELLNRLAQGQGPAKAILLSGLRGGEASRRALRQLLFQGELRPMWMSEGGWLRLLLTVLGAMRAYPGRALLLERRLYAYLAENRRLLDELRARRRAEALRALMMAGALGFSLPLITALLPLLSRAAGHEAASPGIWPSLWALALLLISLLASCLYYRAIPRLLFLAAPLLLYLLGLSLALSLMPLLPR
jgi:hypothetical protein